MDKKKLLIILSFCALFFVVRLIFLLGAHPFYYYLFPDEELWRGAVAMDLIKGLQMSFLDYRADEFTGGFYVISVVLSLIFRILPPTLFAMKLAPLFFAFLAFVCWVALLWRHVNFKTAFIFALLVIFAPSAFVRHTFLGVGDHFETLFFTALSLLCFFEMLYKPKKFSWLWAVPLGLIQGFSMWFCYTTAITIAACSLFWFLFPPRFKFKPSMFLYLISLGIGFSPWLLINQTTGFSGLSIREFSVLNFFEVQGLYNWFPYFQRTSPYLLLGSFAPHHLQGELRDFIKATFSALIVLSTLSSFYPIFFKKWGSKQLHPITISFIYIPIMLFAAQITVYTFLRYLMPAHPFLYAIAALGIAQLTSVSWLSKIKIPHALVSTWVLAGFLSLITMLSPNFLGQMFFEKGYGYTRLPELDPCYEMEQCLEIYAKLKDAMTPRQKDRTEATFAYEYAEINLSENFDFEEAKKLSLKIPKNMKNEFFYFLGARVLRKSQTLSEALVDAENYAKLSPQAVHFIQLGIFDEFGTHLAFKLEAVSALELQKSVPENFLNLYWQAAGRHLGNTWYQDRLDANYVISRGITTVNEIDISYQNDFLEGLGKASFDAWFHSMSLWKPIDIKTAFPLSFQEPIYNGFGKALAMHQMLTQEQKWLQKQIKQASSDASMKMITKGQKLFHLQFFSYTKLESR